MALSEVTTTGNLHDYFGTDFDVRRAKAWATINTSDNTLHDTSTGETRIGGGVATIAADGTVTFTHWAPGADGNPISWQTTYHADVPDRNAPGGRTRVSFGPFTVTTSGLLTALVEEQQVPPTYLTTVTTLLEGYVTAAQTAETNAEAAQAAAEAARDDAVDISGISTSDGVVSALINTVAGPLTQAALSDTIAATQTGLGFVLADATEADLTSTDVHPIGTIDGIGYGRKDAGTLWKTTDGATWTLVASGVQAYGIHALGDGEVIVNGGSTLLRSSGWPTSPTFSVVATANGTSHFLASDVDTYDNLVLAGEYAVPRTDARYVRLSTDYGQTFSVVLDLNTLEPANLDATHWHAVCIDPFHVGANPRLWASHGDAPFNGVYYSDNLGASWTLYDGAWQPMPMCATPAGIVTLTDANDPDGVYLIPRDLSEKQLLLVIDAPAWADTLLGFGIAAHRDPATNVVYMTFRGEQQPSMTSGIPAMIFATDGVRASHIYSTVETGTVGVSAALNFTGLPTLLANGTLLATYTDADGGDRHYITGKTGRGIPTLPPPAAALDRSSVALGPGAVADRQSVIIGSLAARKTDTDFNVVAVGELAQAGDHGTGLGFGVDVGAYAVGVGDDSTAGNEGVAVGQGSIAGTNGTVIGRQAQGGAGSVAIGRLVNAAGAGSVGIAGHPFASPLAVNAILIGAIKATAEDAVAIGNYTTEATGAAAVALGAGAVAPGARGVALTAGSAAHTDSFAFQNEDTTADMEIAMGARMMRLSERADPNNAPANGAFLYIRDNGSGKTQLAIRYATGATAVINTEA